MTERPGMQYLLPCSPSFRCLDRFSILDDAEDLEDSNGTFWPLLTQLLNSRVETPSQLAELLDTIAVTLRETSGPAGDYGLLKSFISNSLPGFFTTHWPLIVQLALELPQHFPDGILPILGFEHTASSLTLSRRQVGCLLAHQFLCTLHAPAHREDYFDFSIWYASGQRHEQACRIYLSCLFKYLEAFLSTSEAQQNAWPVTCALVTSVPDNTPPSSSPERLGPIQIAVVENYQTNPAQLGLPSGAAVVAANRYIGFGQSATQEEVHVGSSPAACPAVLITPPLEQNQVLLVKGAEAVLSIVGERRNIKAEEHEVDPSVNWRQRTMLFMDALELDGESDDAGLADLTSENLSREINKARIAFSSSSYEIVVSPLWGCGAFGGDPFVKVMLLWCAASITKTSLKIICDRGSQGVASSLNGLIKAVAERLETVRGLMSLLQSIPRRTARMATADWMMERLAFTEREL